MSTPKLRTAPRIIINNGQDVVVDLESRIFLTCPACSQLKPLAEFGLRQMKVGGDIRNQSYCTACR